MFSNKSYCLPGWLLPILLLCACNKNTVSKGPQPLHDEHNKKYFSQQQELVQYVEQSPENSALQKAGDFTFFLRTEPADYLALKELNGQPYSPQQFAQSVSEYQDLCYFRLEISNDQYSQELLQYGIKTGSAEYSERVRYCSFNIQQDICLVSGTDSIPCAMSVFERTYNIKPFLNFSLAFPKSEITASNELTFILKDRMFKNGYIRIRLNKDAIINPPYYKI